MNDRGVSILVEYLVLLSILSLFVVVVSLHLNDQLEKIQIGKVIENQFSDVSSQISAQIIDTLTIAPSNGYLKATIRMPRSIGDEEYTVGFRTVNNFSYIYLVSEDKKYEKYLGLGATTLYFQPRGITHSLAVNHSLVFEKKTPIFPSAVLIVRPAVVLATPTQPGVVEVDLSKSSAFGWWKWRVELWNGKVFEGFQGNETFNIEVYWNQTEFEKYCNYDSANSTAYCNITLTVYDLTFNLNDTDTDTLAITNNESKLPDVYIKKFVTPPQVAPGEPFNVSIYLQGRGIKGEATRTALSVVHAMDVSGSMNNPTMFDSFSGEITPKVWKVVFNVNESFLGKGLEIDVYTTSSLYPWFSSGEEYKAIVSKVIEPNGDEYYITGVINGKRYVIDPYISSDELGNWTIETIAAVPKENIELVVDVYKLDVTWVLFWYYITGETLVSEFTTTYSNNYTVVNVNLPSGFTENDEYAYLILRLDKNMATSFYTWANYSGDSPRFCDDIAYYNGKWLLDYSSTVCYFSDTTIPARAGSYSYFIVPKAFPSGDSLNYMGYADIQKLDSARIAAITFNSKLNESDWVGLVDFSYTANAHKVNTSSPYNLTTDKNVVNDTIKTLTASGATNIYYALNQSKMVLLENVTAIENTKPLIILLSDGEPTWGSYRWDPSDPYDDPICSGSTFCQNASDRAVREANDIKSTYIGSENITICTIAFGYDANETFLMNISSSKPSGGKCFYQANNVQELIDAYVDIAKAFKIAAKNVTITDVIPQGLEVVGATVTISGNATSSQPVIFSTSNGTAVQVQIPEVYINDEIFLTIRVVANTPGDYILDVPYVSNVTYEPVPFTGSIKTVYLNVTYGRVSEVTKAVVSIS